MVSEKFWFSDYYLFIGKARNMSEVRLAAWVSQHKQEPTRGCPGLCSNLPHFACLQTQGAFSDFRGQRLNRWKTWISSFCILSCFSKDNMPFYLFRCNYLFTVVTIACLLWHLINRSVIKQTAVEMFFFLFY